PPLPTRIASPRPPLRPAASSEQPVPTRCGGRPRFDRLPSICRRTLRRDNSSTRSEHKRGDRLDKANSTANLYLGRCSLLIQYAGKRVGGRVRSLSTA